MRGAGTETFVRGAAILLNVFMPAVLVGEAAQESFAGHRACDVSNTVLAALGQTCTEQLQSGRRCGRASSKQSRDCCYSKLKLTLDQEQRIIKS